MEQGSEGEGNYAFEWVKSPDDIAPYLNSLYILRSGGSTVEDMMPAYSGQLVILLQGGGTMYFADGSTAKALPAFFQCPFTQAHRFQIEPHTVMMGVSLNFRGWTALTGLPVDEYSDRSLSAQEALDEALAERLQSIALRIRSGTLDEQAALEQLASIVRDGISPISERHRQVIDRTLDWLSSSLKPEIAALYDVLPYSERQVQRLVTRFFGQPPVRLIRRYRAIRAATLLAMPDLPPQLEAEVRDAFYDQAHMIKEIRHFTGRTPKRLLPKENSVVKETLGELGYGSVDLFGGNQDEALGKN